MYVYITEIEEALSFRETNTCFHFSKVDSVQVSNSSSDIVALRNVEHSNGHWGENTVAKSLYNNIKFTCAQESNNFSSI